MLELNSEGKGVGGGHTRHNKKLLSTKPLVSEVSEKKSMRKNSECVCST